MVLCIINRKNWRGQYSVHSHIRGIQIVKYQIYNKAEEEFIVCSKEKRKREKMERNLSIKFSHISQNGVKFSNYSQQPCWFRIPELYVGLIMGAVICQIRKSESVTKSGYDQELCQELIWAGIVLLNLVQDENLIWESTLLTNLTRALGSMA